jgi:ABC-type branched-subunit amino acid transport system substrate-binding protein
MIKRVFGWEQVVVVHDDGSFGTAGAADFVTAVGLAGIKVVKQVSLRHGASSYSAEVTALKALPCRVFWLNMQTTNAMVFIRDAIRADLFNKGRAFLGTDAVQQAFVESASSDAQVASALKGFFGMASSSGIGTAAFDQFFTNWRMQSPLRCDASDDLHVATDTDATDVGLLWQQDHDANPATPAKCNACLVGSDDNNHCPAGVDSFDFATAYAPTDGSKVNAYAPYAYDAVYALAHAVTALFADTSTASFTTNKIVGSELLAHLRLVDFPSVTGRVHFKNASNLDGLLLGDRASGMYNVFNFDGTSQHRKAGVWNHVDGFIEACPNPPCQAAAFPIVSPVSTTSMTFATATGTWHADRYTAEELVCRRGQRKFMTSFGVDCADCAPGTWNWMPDGKCHQCPVGAVCKGKDSVETQQNFWQPPPSANASYPGLCDNNKGSLDLERCELQSCVSTVGACLGHVKLANKLSLVYMTSEATSSTALDARIKPNAALWIESAGAVVNVSSTQACTDGTLAAAAGSSCVQLREIWTISSALKSDVYLLASSGCQAGYTGRLCSVCKSTPHYDPVRQRTIAYGLASETECAVCPEDLTATWVVAFTGMFGVFGVVFVLIVMNMLEGERNFEHLGDEGFVKSDRSPTILFKIFMTFFQVIVVRLPRSCRSCRHPHRLAATLQQCICVRRWPLTVALSSVP